MALAIKSSASFSVIVFVLLLAIDLWLSDVIQSPPLAEHRAAFFFVHGTYLGTALVCSTAGALIGFTAIRARMPSKRVISSAAFAYALLTVLVGPVSLMLAGLSGLAAWLCLGSAATALSLSIFRRPWQPPTF